MGTSVVGVAGGAAGCSERRIVPGACVCLFVCLSVCLSVCLFVCLFVCVFVWLLCCGRCFLTFDVLTLMLLKECKRRHTHARKRPDKRPKTCTRASTLRRTETHTRARAYTHTHARTHTHTHTHTHTYMQKHADTHERTSRPPMRVTSKHPCEYSEYPW